MSLNINYNKLEKEENNDDIVLKTRKMLEFLEEKGLKKYFKLEEYKNSNILYLPYEVYDVDCLLTYELCSYNTNIAKLIFNCDIRNKFEMLKLLNILNDNDMYTKYTVIDGVIEVSVKYSVFSEDFNPAMLYEYMRICINSLRENINYILSCDN